MKVVEASVVITTYNQKELLIRCLKWLKGVSGIANIIVVDNGSSDGTAEFLAQSGYPYIFFDDGVQGCGTIWNAVIDNFELEDTIVFMEPQYLLGEKCILRMAEVLKQENSGIVGPMSNGFFFLQHIPINNLKELPEIEEDLLQSENVAKKALSIGKGLWGLSQKVWKENGRFDEHIVNAKNVLTDYELRMVQKGYQPMICCQALAFYVPDGNYEVDYEIVLQQCDHEVMKNKWGMNYFNLIPSLNIVDLIVEDRQASIQVLEVGCDLGMTLLEIKNRYPNSQIHGLEINEAATEIAKCLMDVKIGNIEEKKLPFEQKFDYIIFGDVLEHLHDPQGIVRFCKERLTENGCILASIPNLMHVSVMEKLLHGRFEYSDVGLLDRSHIHFFTFYEILRMFQEEGYVLEQIGTIATSLTKEQEELIPKLLELSRDVEEHMYCTFQYLVKARKCEE